jgi:hypothetical protein
MRLYLLPELRELLERCGFSVLEGFYFDNGNVYKGPKGLATGLIRSTAAQVPRLRSHIFMRAVAAAEPSATALRRTTESFRQFGLPLPRSIAASASALG